MSRPPIDLDPPAKPAAPKSTKEGTSKPPPRYVTPESPELGTIEIEAPTILPVAANSNGVDHDAVPPRKTITATPFVWKDPAKIPRRQWLYGHHYIRSFLSMTVAFGGVGKSSLDLAEVLAIVTGRPLLGVMPNERTNVWYWNGEDPDDELDRRIMAACLRFQIDRSEIEGRLFVDTGRKTKIVIAKQEKFGAIVMRPVVDDVIATIRANKIGLFVVDPFVSSNGVVENDNPAMEVVAAAWAEIAEETSCAIELVQHSKKTGGNEVTFEDSRGASSLPNKTRSGRVLNKMTENEASQAGVKNRRAFFRVDDEKLSMAPPAEKSDLYQTIGVDLGNGDNVGVVTTWKWPDVFEGVTTYDLREVQAKIRGGQWRESSQSKQWAGLAVAEVLKLDASDKAHRAKINGLLRIWLATGMLRSVEGKDERSETRLFIEVGKPFDSQ